jgi:hypothetical protein
MHKMEEIAITRPKSDDAFKTKMELILFVF